VRIGVHHHDPDVRLLVLEVADGDGHIVENAITLAVFAERMVGAAGKAHAHALGQRGVAGQAGGLHLGGAALEKRGVAGRPSRICSLRPEQAALDPADVFRLMHPLEQVDIGAAHLDDFLRPENSALQQHVLGDTEFLHRKRMSRRQFKFQILRVKAAHGPAPKQQRKTTAEKGQMPGTGLQPPSPRGRRAVLPHRARPGATPCCAGTGNDDRGPRTEAYGSKDTLRIAGLSGFV
jgi:hypothetical protein